MRIEQNHPWHPQDAPVAAPPDQDWEPGELVLGVYEVQARLGEGSVGQVHKVLHRGWNVELAVKTLRPDLVEEPGSLPRFVQESQRWIELGLHPNVVPCYYVRELGGRARVFSAYVDGGSLATWMGDGRLHEGGRDAALRRVLDVGIQMAWGLDVAHRRGFAHQDVRPHNVMMTQDGVARVTDFRLTGPRLATGASPAYASPEQLNDEPGTIASDVWSFAVVILEMFSGQVPGTGSMAGFLLETLLGHPQSWPPQLPPIPPPLAAMLKRCFHIEPSKRPRRVSELVPVLLSQYEAAAGTPYPRQEPADSVLVADSLNNRAVALLDLDDARTAERFLDQAVESEPRHLYAAYNRDLLRWRRGQATDAEVLAHLRGFESKGAERWQVPFLMGLVQRERGDAVSAQRAFQEARRRAGRDQAALRGIDPLLAGLPAGIQSLPSLCGHAESATALALRADALFLLSGSADGSMRLWDVATSRSLVLQGHQGSVRAVSMASQFALAASGGEDGTVRVWDLRSGQCMRVLEGHEGAVRAVAITPRGDAIVSAGDDGTLRLWSTGGGEALQGSEGVVQTLALNADGTVLYTGSDSGALNRWDVAARQVTATQAAHSGTVRDVALAPDGRTLLSGGDDQVVRSWDPGTLAPNGALEGSRAPILSVQASLDRGTVVAACQDKSIRFWDTATGQCVRTLDVEGATPVDVALSATGLLLAAACTDSVVRLWEVPEALPKAPPMVVRVQPTDPQSSEGRFRQALSQATQLTRAGDYGGALKALNDAHAVPGFQQSSQTIAVTEDLARHLRRGPLRAAWGLRTLTTDEAAVTALSASDDGRLALWGSLSGQLQLVETFTGQPIQTLKHGHDGVQATYLGPAGAWAMSLGQKGLQRYWDLAGGMLLHTIEEPTLAFDFSRDGRFCVALHKDGNLRVWQTAGFTCRLVVEAGGVCVGVSPDGQWAATGHKDGSIRLWDLGRGTMVRILRGHGEAVRGVALAADRAMLLSCSDDGTLRLWSWNGESLRVLKGHAKGVAAVAMAPDGQVAVSAGKDRTLGVWDLRQGTQADALAGHGDSLTAVCLSRTGRQAVSAGKDGQVRTWYLDWQLLPAEASGWDEAARPHVQAYLMFLATEPRSYVPAADGGYDLQMTQPQFDELLGDLAACGLGAIPSEAVWEQVQEMMPH